MSLRAFKLVPLQIKNFRRSILSQRDIEWIQGTLDRECRRIETRVRLASESELEVATQPSGKISL